MVSFTDGEPDHFPHVELLRLEPGDTLVVKIDSTMPREALDQIGITLRERFPDHELIFCNGVDLSVIRRGTDEPESGQPCPAPRPRDPAE